MQMAAHTDPTRDPVPTGELPRTVLIVDDDEAFRNRLARVLERRGFLVTMAEGVEDARTAMRGGGHNYAVLDMKLGDGNGTDIVPELRRVNPSVRIVMLTGFGNIASAVHAIKMGAVDYLAKPADPDDIEKALLAQGNKPEPPENPMSADRVRWEHIQRVYELCDRNVSETARRLNMHRRTLQRILAKRSPQ